MTRHHLVGARVPAAEVTVAAVVHRVRALRAGPRRLPLAGVLLAGPRRAGLEVRLVGGLAPDANVLGLREELDVARLLVGPSPVLEVPLREALDLARVRRRAVHQVDLARVVEGEPATTPFP